MSVTWLHRIAPFGWLAAALALGLNMSCAPDRSAVPAATELASPAGPGSAQPNLTLSPSGKVYLSWVEPLADTAHSLRFAVLEGGSWSAPRTVAAGRGWFVNWADFPSLVVLSDSVLAAHWLVRSGGSPYAYDINISRSTDAGATWTPPLVPHRDGTASEHGFVSMWNAGGRDVGLAWLDGRKFPLAERARAEGDSSAASEMTLRSAVWRVDGSLAEEVEVDGRVCDCCQTAAALAAEGPVVVYRDRSAAEVRDIYVTRWAGGNWTPGRPVAEDGWVINGCPVNGPAVAAEGRRVAVAWFTNARDERRAYVAFSVDAGASFGRRIRVDDGEPIGRVDVALDATGDALVSWLEEVGTAAEVRVRRVRPDSSAGRAVTVARSTGERPAGFPQLVRSGAQLVFAWTLPPGSGGPAVRTAVARLDQ